MAILMPEIRFSARWERRRSRDYRPRSRRGWYDYAMLALAFAVLLVGVLGLLR
jgi:hypothetical protein